MDVITYSYSYIDCGLALMHRKLCISCTYNIHKNAKKKTSHKMIYKSVSFLYKHDWVFCVPSTNGTKHYNIKIVGIDENEMTVN